MIALAFLLAVAIVFAAAPIDTGNSTSKGVLVPRQGKVAVVKIRLLAAFHHRQRTNSGESVRKIHLLRRRIHANEKEIHYLRRLMGVKQTPAPTRQLASAGVSRLEAVFRRTHRDRYRAYSRAHNPPPGLAAWMCIHSGIKGGRWSRHLDYLGGGYRVSNGEGSWTDSGAPYWGGLQMSLSFQSTYGGWLLHTKGTANHWTPLEQIWAAVRAWRTRGFSPWPTTARDCGLY